MKTVKNNFLLKGIYISLIAGFIIGILVFIGIYEEKGSFEDAIANSLFFAGGVFIVFFIPFILAALFGTIGNLVTKSINHEKSPIRIKYMRDLKTKTIANLCAEVMRSDNVVSDNEWNALNKYLKLHIPDEKQQTEIREWINNLLQCKVSIGKVCLEARKELTYKERFEICNLLLDIAAAENGICIKEAELIKKIMNFLLINETDRELLWMAFGFRYREKEGNAQKIITNEKLNKYLAVLESDDDTPLSEIKKRYKKLCFKHHPDNYENSDEKTKNYHSSKMKEINEAYNYILQHHN